MHKLICVAFFTIATCPVLALERLEEHGPSQLGNVAASMRPYPKAERLPASTILEPSTFFPYVFTYREIRPGGTGREFGIQLRYQWE